MDKESDTAQKAVSKSEKTWEVEVLLHDNEMPQNKLHSPEDDFHLQNSMLMQKSSEKCSQTEWLEEDKRM